MDDGKAGEENMRFFSRAFSLPITPRAGVPRTLGNLRSDNGDENIKKAIGSVSKQQLCTCITLFVCTFLCRHCKTTTCKCLVSRSKEDVNKPRRGFLFPSELRYGS